MASSENSDIPGLFVARTELLIPSGLAGPAEMSLDVRAFVVDRGEGVVVVDTLMEPGHVGLVLAALQRSGTDIGQLQFVVLTHSHIDHTGGLATLAVLAPQAQILCGVGDVEAIHASTGLRPDAIAAGERVGGLEVFPTPGHTPGHLCLFEPASSTMLLGDLAGNVDGLRRPPAAFTADRHVAEESLRALAERRFDNAIPSHGEPIIGGAHGAVARLAASVG